MYEINFLLYIKVSIQAAYFYLCLDNLSVVRTVPEFDKKIPIDGQAAVITVFLIISISNKKPSITEMKVPVTSFSI